MSLNRVLSLGLMTKDPLNSCVLKLIHYYQHEFSSEQAMKKYLTDLGHLALKCGEFSLRLHLFQSDYQIRIPMNPKQ